MQRKTLKDARMGRGLTALALGELIGENEQRIYRRRAGQIQTTANRGFRMGGCLESSRRESLPRIVSTGGAAMNSDKMELARMAFIQLNKAERRAFLETFTAPIQLVEAKADRPARIMRRKEVSALLGRSERAIDRLAALGTLRRVTLPGQARSVGYLESEIHDLLADPGAN